MGVFFSFCFCFFCYLLWTSCDMTVLRGKRGGKQLLSPSLSAASPALCFGGAGALQNQQTHYRLTIPKAAGNPLFVQGSWPGVSVLQGFSCWPLPGMKWPRLRARGAPAAGGRLSSQHGEHSRLLLELVVAVSGNKDSFLGQVKQLSAWLLLKGFELCPSPSAPSRVSPH